MDVDVMHRALFTWTHRRWVNLQIRIKQLQIRYRLASRAARASADQLPFTDQMKQRVYVAVNISPHPLLGHQVSSWIAGLMWSRRLGASFIGGVVPADDKGLFDFSDATQPCLPPRSIRITSVAIGDERDPRSELVLKWQLSRRLTSTTRPVAVRLRRDPQWWDQIPAAPAIRRGLQAGYLGEFLQELEAGAPYIALHVRRGDGVDPSVTGDGEGDGARAIGRWVTEDYYLNVIRQLRSLDRLASLPVHVVSIDDLSDFTRIASIENLHFRTGGSRDSDLVFLAGAAVLVTSPSSFSFTAALASRGVIVVRHPWWHRVPNEGRWVQADYRGVVDLERLEEALCLALPNEAEEIEEAPHG